jgi:hypothetical protein
MIKNYHCAILCDVVRFTRALSVGFLPLSHLLKSGDSIIEDLDSVEQCARVLNELAGSRTEDRPMLQHRLAEFVTLFVILDPAGVLPIFIALTADCTPEQRRRVALLAIFMSFWVLTAFIVGGEIVLQLMGIPLRSFQIAGGIVLFLYGVGMVLGEVKDTPAPATSDAIMSLAIYPIAIPGIAGPGFNSRGRSPDRQHAL